MERRDAQHDTPVWGDRADFVIGALLPEPDRAEQLRVRQLGDFRFELCCIPFFLYNVALGDVVETDVNYDLRRVVSPSGRWVFRVWFGETFLPREQIAAELTRLGALLEWSSLNMLAIDASDERIAQTIADYLADAESTHGLIYETGRT